MPIYEYQCGSCGHRLEKLQRLSDDQLRDCHACGESTLNKVASPAAFRLKGAGWYETDFKTGDKKNALHTDDSSSKQSPDAGSKADVNKTEKNTEVNKNSTSSSKTDAVIAKKDQ